MPVHNADIAAVFEEIAELLEIEQANPFRIRAYRNAARTLGELGPEVRSLIADGEDLTELPGIGDDLAGKIREVVATGSCGMLTRLRTEVPPAIAELLQVPGLGPRRLSALWHDLDIRSPEQLAQAARTGRIRNLPGFGEKSEARILASIEAHLSRSRRIRRSVAAGYAASLVERLAATRGVHRVEVAGSYRRRCETVGDLDMLVSAVPDSEAMARFTTFDDVAEVRARGAQRGSVVLGCGLQVDLRIVDDDAWGAALCYFTGAQAHNIALRRMAIARGLKLNEYGLYRGENRIAGTTEAEIYSGLGLAWVPPELREDAGELAAARDGTLPTLVELDDLRGDLHVHTRASDGRATLEEMARAAKAHGLSFLGITEHSRRLAMAHGLDAERLARQCEEIDRLNETLDGITLLKGIEVDILEDGRLDLPDAALCRLDLVVGAVHSRFDLSRERQTERILRAMDNRHLSLLAHPTGRLLDRRAPCDIDMARIVAHARECGCHLELNAQPDRLDLTDLHCRMAREAGVLVSINSDAHGRDDFAHLRWGIDQARRGWLSAGDVLNTRPLGEVRRLLVRG